MTKRAGNIIIIEEEEPQQCDQCGKIDELRPYGPNGSAVCFQCAMKDKSGTDRRMGQVLFGDK